MNGRSVRGMVLFLLLVGVVIVARLAPHPMNWTPAAAVALFGGFYFQRRLTAVCVVVVAMAIGDAALGTYDARLMLVVYAALCAPVLLGGWVRSRFTALRVGASSVAGSLMFFLMTNLAVWLFTPMYARTPVGLAECYALALPFLKHTISGDLVWSVILFTTYAVVSGRWSVLAAHRRHDPLQTRPALAPR